MRFALRVCAYIEQQRRFRGLRRNHRGQRRPIDTRKRADHHLRRRHRRAGISRRNKTVSAAFHYELRTNSQRTLLLAPHGSGDGIVHRDNFSRVYQLNASIAIASPTASSQFRLNLMGLAHKNNSHAEVARRSEGAINLHVRRMVTSHRVENDLARQWGLMLRLTSHRLILVLFYLHHFATFVMAAFGANTVGHAGLTAIRAQRGLGDAQGIVRATFVSTSFECRRFGFGIITPL